MNNPFLKLSFFAASFFSIASFLFILIEPFLGHILIINVIYFLSILVVGFTITIKGLILLIRRKGEKYLQRSILDVRLEEIKRRSELLEKYRSRKSNLGFPERIELLSSLIYYDHEKILYYEASLNEEIFEELKTYLNEESWKDIEQLLSFYQRKRDNFRFKQIIRFPKISLIRDFVIIIDKDIASIISNDLKYLVNSVSKIAPNER